MKKLTIEEALEEVKYDYLGECAENLCCGSTLQHGVWMTDYICNDQQATKYGEYDF